MKRSMTAALATALIVLSTAHGRAADDLLARAAQINPSLHSFTAAMNAHVALTSFPFLQTDVSGTYYHKDPDRDKLDITSSLPGMAAPFSKLYPHIVPPSQWADTFAVTKTGDDGTTTTYKLVPKVRGNIDRIDASIDDKAATVTSLRWNYANGGWASMQNTYRTIDGNTVVVAQKGHVEEPQYKGDITATLGDYKFNAPISDEVFQQ